MEEFLPGLLDASDAMLGRLARGELTLGDFLLIALAQTLIAAVSFAIILFLDKFLFDREKKSYHNEIDSF